MVDEAPLQIQWRIVFGSNALFERLASRSLYALISRNGAVCARPEALSDIVAVEALERTEAEPDYPVIADDASERIPDHLLLREKQRARLIVLGDRAAPTE